MGDEERAGSPAAVDFTPERIRRAVLAETLQHPLTVWPAAAAGVAGLYMVLVDLNPASFAVGLLCGLLSAGSWVVNYFIRGDSLARRHVEGLLRLRRDGVLAEVVTLEAEFEAAGLELGANQARELREAFARLEGLLREDSAQTESPTLQRFAVLAEDAYRQGLCVLRTALHLQRALRAVDREKLENELEVWRREEKQRLSRLRPGEDRDDPRLSALRARIAGHERRLQLYRERAHAVDGLLAECEVLEAALETTYLEVADRANAEALVGSGDAASALERAVAAARRVEERLRLQDAEGGDEQPYLVANDQTPEKL